MQRHVAYWLDRLARGQAVAFGPVMDPAGPWGLGLVESDSEEDARTLANGDPVLGAGLGFRYELHSMPGAHVRPA
jgi:uncharacterized protein